MLEDDTRWVMVGLKGNKTNEQNTETMAVTPNIGVSHRFVQIISQFQIIILSSSCPRNRLKPSGSVWPKRRLKTDLGRPKM
jgi:hypothetical protein